MDAYIQPLETCSSHFPNPELSYGLLSVAGIILSCLNLDNNSGAEHVLSSSSVDCTSIILENPRHWAVISVGYFNMQGTQQNRCLWPWLSVAKPTHQQFHLCKYNRSGLLDKFQMVGIKFPIFYPGLSMSSSKKQILEDLIKSKWTNPSDSQHSITDGLDWICHPISKLLAASIPRLTLSLK